MTPAAIVTAALGIAMATYQGWHWMAVTGWFHVKLALVGILVVYHAYLGRLTAEFALDRNRHTDVFYRWINEFPLLVLVGTIALAEVKPF
jgi:putative membrane protein